MKSALLFVPGALFGIGLLLSGMSNPAKVIGFLDVAGGAWDPSLMFVMVGAIGTFAVINLLVHRRAAPLFGGCLPGARARGAIGARLLIGSAVFGVGWGLLGICPGPALTDLATFDREILVFVGAMIAGMIVSQRVLGADVVPTVVAPASPPPQVAQSQ
ncbi:MAG: YeeE/YedE family protein [Planctomycetes bacterium]|nr:YeeE/YedE family protein [Planctomycetota bacterium]